LGYNIIAGLFMTEERPMLSSVHACEDKSANERKTQRAEGTNRELTVQERELVKRAGNSAYDGKTMSQDNGAKVHGPDTIKVDEKTDWRVPLIRYIQEPGITVDRKVR
jgi:hypothetical protein